MAMKMAAAIYDVILIAGAGCCIANFLEQIEKQTSAADEAFVNDVLPKISEMCQEFSKIQDEISGKAGNITSLIIPTVTIGALTYGIMCFKHISLSKFLFPTKRSIRNPTEAIEKKLDQISTALEVVILRKEQNNRNQQINNQNQQIEGMEKKT